MGPVSSPKPAPEINLAVQPVTQEPGPAAEAAERRIAEHAAAMRNELIPDKLLVRLDVDAQRFVQIITDANTAETVRRYPNEGQLAFSRAVMAYLRALTV